ncbi:MAG TPA: hypothetical protein VEO54_30535 [Thermoanaerobaculia bacterium]|nr:hypothetical protein [Thermoanaerobaculia bacterium]
MKNHETTGGLLVVERYVSDRSPHGHFTEMAVRHRYRGFDGHAWPGNLVNDVELIDGLAPLSELDKLLPYWKGIGDAAVDLVYCSFGEDPELSGFQFLGFDAGYFCSEYLHYSIVLNEVLYGSASVMTAFAAELNEHLLFDTEARAQALLTVRQGIARSEASLEIGDEPLQPIAIFAPPRSGG